MSAIRNALVFIALLALGVTALPSQALNPQPEVPSKAAPTQRPANLKALNPRPGVPSKNKKKSPARGQKKSPPKTP